MFWLLEVPWGKAGLPTILGKKFTESKGNHLTRNQILTTDPDLAYIARTVYEDTELGLFPTEFTVEAVLENKLSMSTVKKVRHYFLLADRYEIVGRIQSENAKYFKISGVMGLQQVIVTSFRLGSPVDD